MAQAGNCEVGEEQGWIELIPDVLDTGADTDIRVILTGERARRLAGKALDILDGAGAVSTQLTLLLNDEGSAIGICKLPAPDDPGRAVWTAHLPEVEDDGIPAFELAFDVRAHSLSLTLWDVPLAVERGARFSLRAGLRCSAGCDMSGQRIVFLSEDGGTIVSAKTREMPKEGTEAVYWAEIDFEAPSIDGKAAWEVTGTADGLLHCHTEARAQMAINVVSPAEHKISVSVIDAETSAPIARAKVVAHPFQTFTDAGGRAELRLPSGPRRLFVSGPDHIPYQVEGDVTEDIDITAALDRDKPITEAEIWA